MKKPMLLAAVLMAATALPSFAQSELDRMEAASEAVSQNMATFMVERAPVLADVMPDWSWDDDMRAAASCTVDAIRAEGGDAAVTAYLDALEAFAEVEITSMEQLGTATPVPINADFAAATGQTCGTAEIAMQQMQETGLMQAMMDPAVMTALMGQ